MICLKEESATGLSCSVEEECLGIPLDCFEWLSCFEVSSIDLG